MEQQNQNSSGSWRVRGRPGNTTVPPVKPTPPSMPGAPPLIPQVGATPEPFHTTRIPKSYAAPVAAPKAPPTKRQSVPAPRPAATKPKDGNMNVTININMPKFKKPQLPDWPWKKLRRYAIIAAALIIASIVLRFIIVQEIERHRLNEAKNRLDTIQPIKKNPTFKPLVPGGDKTTVAKTASYDGSKDSFSFSDKIKGTDILVSQQALQAGLSIADTVAKAAKSLDATKPLLLANGTAYMSASAKTGGQTIVLGRGQTLVFVQSPIAHSEAEWVSYLDNLSTT